MIARFDLVIPLAYFVTAIFYAVQGLYAWRRRPAVAVTPFAWAMLGMSIWSFAYGLEIYLPSLSAKVFISGVEYIGIVIIPVFLFLFALEFSGKSHLLSPRARLWIWVFPALILFLVWTNPLHHLMWDRETVIQTGVLVLLSVRFGTAFWLHLFFSYGLLVSAGVLLVTEMLQNAKAYRTQLILIVPGILLPMAGSLLFVYGNASYNLPDLTPLSFFPAALGISWTISKHRLLEILPPEHVTVLKNMKDGVVVLNAHQRIIYINPIAQDLLNHTEDEVIGQPLAKISNPDMGRLSPYLTSGEHRVEIEIGEGSQAKVFEATVSPILPGTSGRLGGRADTIVTLHDITQRKKTEAALSRRESIMSAISLTAELFLRESAWEHNIPGVLEKIGQAANVSRVYVAMNYRDKDQIVYSSLCYEWAAPGVSPQINKPVLRHVAMRREGFIRWENTLSQGFPIHGAVRDMPKEEQKFLQTLDILSLAIMPIFVENQWWGFLGFDECRDERQWTDTELEAFHAAANIFGAAETRARTEQKARQKQNSLNLLNDIVRESLQAKSLKGMAQNAVDRLSQLINADGCFLTLWDEVQKKASPLAAYGPYSDAYETIHFPTGERTFTESALALGGTLIVEDAYASPYVDIEIAKNFPYRSVAVFPLLAGGKKLGALIFAFDSLRTFQPEEITTSEQAASLIALAFEKFQAVEDAQQRASTSEMLRKASMAVAEKLEMEETVSHILEQLNRVVPYDSASVQLLVGNELEIIGGRGWDDPSKVIGIRFPIPGDNPNSVVVETGKPFHLPKTWEVYKEFSKPPHNHIRSWLGVPLIFQEKTIGLLAIDSSEADHFKDGDVETASEFANQVAVALENARLFEETQTQALLDPLTAIYNRRGLLGLGKIAFERSAASSKKFTAIMMDVDRFKRVNDAHGHDAGDKVLKELVVACKKYIRDTDLMGRYGGEEIVIFLPDADIVLGLKIAERLRREIEDKSIEILDNTKIHVTVSLGVAALDENTTTLDILVNRADQAMYVAKYKGRNRVVTSGPSQAHDQD